MISGAISWSYFHCLELDHNWLSFGFFLGRFLFLFIRGLFTLTALLFLATLLLHHLCPLFRLLPLVPFLGSPLLSLGFIILQLLLERIVGIIPVPPVLQHLRPVHLLPPHLPVQMELSRAGSGRTAHNVVVE